MASNQNQATANRKSTKKGRWLPIIIIAVIIVFLTLFLTVLFVDEFKTIGDLFRFIATPQAAQS